MATPKHINYSNVKPLGIPSEILHAKFYPQTTFQTINSNDIVRFQINVPDGFWDPYSAYIYMEVDFSDMPSGLTQQLDSSAQGFFNELILSCKGKEIERIQEYDTLSCILNDMAYTSDKRYSRLHEGMGYNLKGHGPNFVTTQQLNQSLVGENTAATARYHVNALPSYGLDPCKNWNAICDLLLAEESKTLSNRAYWQGPGDIAFAFTSNADPNSITNAGTSTLGDNSTKMEFSIFGAMGLNYTQAIRFQANKNKFKPTSGAGVGTAYTPTAGQISGVGSWATNTKVDRNILENMTNFGLDKDLNFMLSKGIGLNNFHCPSLTNANWEPTFSKSYKQKLIYAGAPYESSVVQQSFCIPLLSSVIGCLMPRESYKYVPIYALQDLMLELRINPYALFTSGYYYAAEDFNTFMQNAGTMANRSFKIKNIVINAEIMKFTKEVRSIVDGVISSGLTLHTASYALGPQYLIANTANASGTFHINMPFDSLKSMFMIFLSNDYLKYPYCRKQFRKSNNLTWFQVKVGTTFYPSLPIQGNAGDAMMIRNTGGNADFILSTLKAFGKFHDVMGDSHLNVVNFAVNSRIYDVTASGKFYEVSTDSVVNSHTAMGLPLLWENLCRGCAIYGINFETLNQDTSVVSGINTVRGPFEVNIKSDSSYDSLNQTLYDRDSTMMTFLYYDKLIVIKPDGIDVLGYGS